MIQKLRKKPSMINSSLNAWLIQKNGYKAYELMATNLRISCWSEYIKNGKVSWEFRQKPAATMEKRGVAVGLEKKGSGRKKGLGFCTVQAHHRRFVLQTGSDALAGHQQRFVPRTGDRQHHRRFQRPLRPPALDPAVIPHHRRFVLNQWW